MRKYFIIIALILISVSVFASNPNLISVDSNQFYLNQSGSFILTMNPDDTNGKIEFYDNSQLVSITNYDSSSGVFIFNRSFSITGNRTIRFVLTDINGSDTNSPDNNITKIISVMKGVDLSVIEITTTDTTVTAGSRDIVSVKVQNIGDVNFVGTFNLNLYADTNLIGTKQIVNLGVLEERKFTYDWNVPSDFNQSTLRVNIVNNGTVTEASLINNEKTQIVSDLQKSDLTVKTIDMSTSLRKDFIETITIVIKNVGQKNVVGAQVEVWVDSVTENSKIYSNTISINGNSEKSFDFVYSFPSVKEYKMIAMVNRQQIIPESNFSNNTNELNVSVFDFNLNAILNENDSLKKQLAEQIAKYDGVDIERQSCLTSLATQRSENETCASNLNVCNSNNNTKIANYMTQIDANREAEKTIYLGQIASITQEKKNLVIEYEGKLASKEDEKNQWAMLVILILIVGIGFIIYVQVLKNMPQKGINQRN